VASGIIRWRTAIVVTTRPIYSRVKEIPNTYQKRRADFGVLEKCEVSCPYWKQNYDPLVVKPVV